jgi:hypothetical protein
MPVKGVDNYAAAWRRTQVIHDRLATVPEDLARALGELLQREIRRRVPVDTGNLARAFETLEVRAGRFYASARVGDPARLPPPRPAPKGMLRRFLAEHPQYRGWFAGRPGVPRTARQRRAAERFVREKKRRAAEVIFLRQEALRTERLRRKAEVHLRRMVERAASANAALRRGERAYAREAARRAPEIPRILSVGGERTELLPAYAHLYGKAFELREAAIRKHLEKITRGRPPAPGTARARRLAFQEGSLLALYERELAGLERYVARRRTQAAARAAVPRGQGRQYAERIGRTRPHPRFADRSLSRPPGGGLSEHDRAVHTEIARLRREIAKLRSEGATAPRRTVSAEAAARFAENLRRARQAKRSQERKKPRGR